MVKLHCDKCGEEIKDTYYYTIDIYKNDINPKYNNTCDYASSFANIASGASENMLKILNSQKMYCDKCKNEIEKFICND